MLITHTIALDLLQSGAAPRIQVKQGDMLSHNVELQLFAGGEPWFIPEGAEPVIRWAVQNPDTGEAVQGVYNCMPDGLPAWQIFENRLQFIPAAPMFIQPGLVRTDAAFLVGETVIATCNFEFYVNRAPVNDLQPEQQNYPVHSLAAIRETLADLQSQIDRLQEAMEAL